MYTGKVTAGCKNKLCDQVTTITTYNGRAPELPECPHCGFKTLDLYHSPESMREGLGDAIKEAIAGVKELKRHREVPYENAVDHFIRTEIETVMPNIKPTVSGDGEEFGHRFLRNKIKPTPRVNKSGITEAKINLSVWMLEELAAVDPDSIDSNEIEVVGEDLSGREGSCNVKITNIAKQALAVINHLRNK